MAGSGHPDDDRDTGNSSGSAPGDLEGRKRALDAALATRRPAAAPVEANRTGTVTGIGNALKLSSEFIAGVIVGAGIGWFIDRLAGTSPWGLIVFLFLGFAAGVINVLRSSGQMAEFGASRDRAGRKDDR